MSFSYSQIEALWIQYGGNPGSAAMAAAIAMAESGGNPNATNTANSNGTTDRGLFQINSIWGSRSTWDLATNIKAAISISSNGSNWQPWSTYNNGAYRRFYSPGTKPSGGTVATTSGGGPQVVGNQSIPATTDNSGVSIANSGVAAAIPNPTPILSLDQLRSQAPLVAAIVTSVPELSNIFQQAIAGQWSTDKFISAVQNSNWWKTTSDSARQTFALMKADPATYQQNITNLQGSLQQMAAQLGANISASDLQALAVDATTNGYDQNQAVLRQHFQQFIQPISGVHFGGEAGTDEQQIRTLFRDLGIITPEPQLQEQIRQIVGGNSTVASVAAQLRTQAEGTYPAYSQQIKQGLNVSDIASPYISRAQQLLERGTGGVNVFSPMITSALQYKNDQGKPDVMPMGLFENQVRKDPSWLGTDNAQDQFMSTAHTILQNFGLQY